jgi:hypothetical protein
MDCVNSVNFGAPSFVASATFAFFGMSVAFFGNLGIVRAGAAVGESDVESDVFVFGSVTFVAFFVLLRMRITFPLAASCSLSSSSSSSSITRRRLEDMVVDEDEFGCYVVK